MSNYNFLVPLFERYRDLLDKAPDYGFPKRDKCGRDHLIDLCNEAIKGIYSQNMAYGKLCRWLGFIQGVMCSEGLITVDEERNFTRPIFRENEV